MGADPVRQALAPGGYLGIPKVAGICLCPARKFEGFHLLGETYDSSPIFYKSAALPTELRQLCVEVGVLCTGVEDARWRGEVRMILPVHHAAA